MEFRLAMMLHRQAIMEHRGAMMELRRAMMLHPLATMEHRGAVMGHYYVSLDHRDGPKTRQAVGIASPCLYLLL